MMRDQNDNSLDAVFEPLEMKIQRVVDLCRELREERALMQKEIAVLLLQVETITDEKRKLERRIDHLVAERRELRRGVESILDAVATLEIEAESTGR